jgi:hypothetical protein
VSRGERRLNGEESCVGETFAGGVGEHFWMTGSNVWVQSCARPAGQPQADRQG